MSSVVMLSNLNRRRFLRTAAGVLVPAPFVIGQSLRNPAFVARLTSASVANNTTDWNKGFESGITDMTETDASSKLDPAATGKFHSGSKSLSVTLDADSVVAYVKKDLGAVKSAMSICFWHYADTSSTGDYSLQLAVVGQSTVGNWCLAGYYSKVGSTYGYKLRGTGYSTVQAVTTGNWYRVEIQYVQNSTTTLKVFDSAGAQVGSDQTCTANNNNSQYLYFGSCVTSGTTRWNTIYIDDIGVDYTDSTFPLWPYALSN